MEMNQASQNTTLSDDMSYIYNEDIEEKTQDFIPILWDLEYEEDYGERLDVLYALFDEQINNMGEYTKNSNFKHFAKTLKMLIIDKVNDDNKQYALECIVDTYSDP